MTRKRVMCNVGFYYAVSSLCRARPRGPHMKGSAIFHFDRWPIDLWGAGRNHLTPTDHPPRCGISINPMNLDA